MSRCYPFPPPGFVPRLIQKDESLIESTKKGTKEEVKREKEDRKHNKDKKRKDRDNEAGRSRKRHHHKRQRKDESSANASKKVNNDNEPECLEKSSLTMELDHQTSSQTSSDSTLHSSENHIQSQSLDGRHNNDSETNKDQKQCELLDASQAAPSESRDASSACQEKRRDPVIDASIDISTKLSTEKETNRQTSMQLGKEEKRSSRHQEATGPSKLCRKRPSSTSMRFLNLIENWSPDQVESSKLTDSGDQEWWLLMKVGAKRHRQVSVQTRSSGSSSTMVWPSARFLPEAELHALPFTVPF